MTPQEQAVWFGRALTLIHGTIEKLEPGANTSEQRNILLRLIKIGVAVSGNLTEVNMKLEKAKHKEVKPRRT